MKLKLKNIGKIESANIDIEGITVIAGLNCTGKSTINHALFAALQSLGEIPGQSVLQIFLDELDGHITNICNTNNGQIELKTENSEIIIHFNNENKLLELKRKNELPHKVIYIDDAFKNTKIMSSLIYLTRTMALITKDKELQNADSKDELSLIYEKIDNILNSDKSLFKTDKNDKSGTSKLSLESLSSGVKVFYLIKSLIDTGIIVKNSTLILDAPETHLHPNLKIALAEIVVLLQKEMKLHILTNIYSPYFLRAIEVFSKKYDIADTTKYYLSYNDGDNAKIKDVTLNTSEIYKELSDPLQRLENEGYREEI